VTDTGKCIGQHEGLMYYTIGQRQGLQIGGQKDSNGQPWYVARKNISDNQLIVVQGEHHPWLYQQELVISQLSWVCGMPPTENRHYAAKTRYRQADQPCQIQWITKDALRIIFDTPQRAITPGQSCVLYDKNICLGGGVIT